MEFTLISVEINGKVFPSPGSHSEDNHALALVQVLPPDTELSDVPDYVDIYHVTITDDSVIGAEPPPQMGQMRIITMMRKPPH